MALTTKTFQTIAMGPPPPGGTGQGVRLHWYTSNDLISAIMAADYFLSLYKVIRTGDIILVSGDMDGTDMPKLLLVTASTASTVTVAATQPTVVDLTDNTGGSGSHDDTVADGLTATAPDAITEYTPHASGGTTVTSNAATDLDTTAAALNTLVDEVQALRETVAACVTDLGVQNQNDSDMAQKIKEIIAALAANGITKAS